MSHYAFQFMHETLHALPSGALYWPKRDLLCISDLHFGKAQRYAAHGGGALPPYETLDTLLRLEHDIAEVKPSTIICLGDSFDRIDASADLDADARRWIARLQTGRRWIWIEGNHDPGPMDIGGTHLTEFEAGQLVFRHISQEDAQGEISGHYHPKVTLNLRSRRVTQRCFVMDQSKLILPAYGTYTGGLSVLSEPLLALIANPSVCILTGGSMARAVPRPKPS